VTFGLTSGDWRAENIEYGAVSQFTLTERGREIASVETTQLGSHNIENMVGIGAFVLTRGLASVDQYTAAMASFRGVMRRLDRKSYQTIPACKCSKALDRPMTRRRAQLPR
jgi:UDP-N-acetylmuramate: L-alanyl-gamma-D-glutamyl-meso-diaminopimelate ligase